MRQAQLPFDTTVLYSTKHVTEQHSNVEKALILGAYASNLAYCVSLKQQNSTLNYLAATERLSIDLGIEKDYNSIMLKQVERNLDQNDSLIKIASRAYATASNGFQQSGQVNVLPFVVLGHWMESMHLALATTNQTDKQKVIEQVVAQRSVVNHLVDYLYEVMIDTNAFELNGEIQDMLGRLSDIQDLYNSLQTQGANTTITDAQYLAIVEKITSIRKQYMG